MEANILPVKCLANAVECIKTNWNMKANKVGIHEYEIVTEAVQRNKTD